MNIITQIYSKLHRKLNYAGNDIQTMFGLNEQKFRHAAGAMIIVYHGICQSDHTRFNSIFLQLKTLEKHLQFYKKYFQVVSLDDYYNQRFDKDRFTVCLSFDDGFANNYKYVLPLMEKYRVPVVFFITAIREAGYDILWNDLLCLVQKYGPPEFRFKDEPFYKDKYGRYVSKSSGSPLKDSSRGDGFDKKAGMIKLFETMLSDENKMREKDYWLQMTGEEIKILSASPFATIGCHGYYHNDLSRISIKDARDEMIRSKQWLENITQKDMDAIAFPYGAYSREVVAEAKAAGFNKLLATDFLFDEDHADLAMRERFTVNPYISVNNQMLATIKGKYLS
jgi:peptidoglycan/xylan/chitin deacetylase (PgdA/CDA1 family)